MSPETHDLTWSELDRLVDYTADALPPTDAARVAYLVATDPRWSAAHRAVLQADSAVRTDLAAAAALPAPIPDDVAAQIDAALRRLTPAGATVISLDAARAKRRRALTAGIVAAAATVVAVIGGIAVNTGLIRSDTNPMSAPAEGQAGRDATNMPAPAASALAGADAGVAGNVRVLASGADYRLDTLSQLAAQAPPPGQANDSSKTAESPQFTAGEAPGALARLATTAGVADCLRSVAASYPGVAVVLDYARFEGQPALVIVVRQADSSKIIAVGPECGLSGTDERAAVSTG
jgi:hypothetical protein